MKEINILINRLESEINKTPTGDLRNLLCDANIVIQTLISHRKSRDEVVEKPRDLHLDIVDGNYPKGLNKWYIWY